MNYTKNINDNQVMKSIPINNSHVLECLNNFLWFWRNPTFHDNVHTTCNSHTFEDGWTSEEYMRKIIDMGNAHDGYPESCKAKAMAANRLVEKPTADKGAIVECIRRFTDYNTQLSQAIMARNNALGVIYPPGGFISWHNNQNAPGYNLIFSYAETDTGFFEYYDSNTEEIVKLYDTPGKWTCKAGYFADFEESFEKKVYHSASAPEDDRMTVSYVFNASEMSNGLHDETIEEIMSDF